MNKDQDAVASSKDAFNYGSNLVLQRHAHVRVFQTVCKYIISMTCLRVTPPAWAAHFHCQGQELYDAVHDFFPWALHLLSWDLLQFFQAPLHVADPSAAHYALFEALVAPPVSRAHFSNHLCQGYLLLRCLRQGRLPRIHRGSSRALCLAYYGTQFETSKNLTHVSSSQIFQALKSQLIDYISKRRLWEAHLAWAPS